jgi:Tol biopolymer transport system component
VASDGTEGDAMTGSRFSFSADGRYIAFDSYATNLVPGDTNGSPDVFVRDTQMGMTTRVSLRNTGAQAKGASGGASISADGRFVAFNSNADNLVADDTNRSADVFVRDTALGTTTRVSVAGSGAQGSDGSGEPSITADGRFVAFTSHAGNLVVGDSNKLADVFRRSLMACSDGVDNDGDGAIDHPDDPGCDSATDISEARVLRFDTSTTFKYRASSFKGRVGADNKRCLGKRKVVLRRANEKRVGRTTTDRDGRWSISKPRAKGRYYATVKEQAKPAKHLDTVVCHAVKTDLLRRH